MANFGDPRLPIRFWSKVRVGEGGCWLWAAGTRAGGYGDFYWNGQAHPGHRLAYEILIGEIPEGLVCDHLCRVRRCVNPAHIEPVTNQENIRRGDAGRLNTLRAAAITHCPRGHDYSPENSLIRKGRYRECRTCERARMRRVTERRREIRSRAHPLKGD